MHCFISYSKLFFSFTQSSPSELLFPHDAQVTGLPSSSQTKSPSVWMSFSPSQVSPCMLRRQKSSLVKKNCFLFLFFCLRIKPEQYHYYTYSYCASRRGGGEGVTVIYSHISDVCGHATTLRHVELPPEARGRDDMEYAPGRIETKQT